MISKFIYKFFLLSLIAFVLLITFISDKHNHTPHISGIPVAQVELTTAQFVAVLDVARVFGRSPACAEASPKLIRTVAEESLKATIDPRTVAATIAVESGCNQFAVSSRGAVGLLQIVPRTWQGTYDFEHQYNLLNPDDNIHVGIAILAGLIKQYGAVNGLRRYNGIGEACATCDLGYTDRVTSLAARR